MPSLEPLLICVKLPNFWKFLESCNLRQFVNVDKKVLFLLIFGLFEKRLISMVATLGTVLRAHVRMCTGADLKLYFRTGLFLQVCESVGFSACFSPVVDM